jgi:hypothetical protein
MSAPNFFDVNELLAGDERVKCTFLRDAVDCAFLDPSCVGDDLKSGAVVELPLWLAEPLAEHQHVVIDVPQFLTPRFRRIMKAGPASVNLREFSPYVYEVARRVVPFVEDPEAKDIDEILRLAFGGDRFREILNNSMNAMNEDTTEFTRKLTEDEKQLFSAGARDLKDFMLWKGRHADVISAAAVVDRTSKRRKL